MKTRCSLLLLTAALLLSGCERPVEADLWLRSSERLDEEITATVPAADRDLVVAMSRRLLPGEWRLRQSRRADQITLWLHRRVDLRYVEGAKLEQAVIGPLHLRRQFDLTYPVSLNALEANHPLRTALSGIDLTVRLHVPGVVIDDDGTNAPSNTADAATWTFKLSDLAGQPQVLRVRARAWRLWLLGTIVLVVGVVLWVVWPALAPPPEVRRTRAEQRAARRAEKERRQAARQAKAAARAEAKAAKRAKREERRAAAPTAPVEQPLPAPPAEPVEDSPLAAPLPSPSRSRRAAMRRARARGFSRLRRPKAAPRRRRGPGGRRGR